MLGLTGYSTTRWVGVTALLPQSEAQLEPCAEVHRHYTLACHSSQSPKCFWQKNVYAISSAKVRPEHVQQCNYGQLCLELQVLTRLGHVSRDSLGAVSP